MKKRSNLGIVARLIGLVAPLTGYMLLAITLGVMGHLCALFIPVFGGMALLDSLGVTVHLQANVILLLVAVLALLRGIFRYGEQYCNHFIAFKLLALIRDKVFACLRRLCPAKLDGREKGNLISLITSDIELLEVFYAHTISPVAIALVMALLLGAMLAHLHPLLALIALGAYATVGILIPLATSQRSGEEGRRFRAQSGELSAFVLDSLRGLSETLQFGAGGHRLAQMMARTEQLSQTQQILKKHGGTNSALTQTAILFFDLVMLLASAQLYRSGDILFSQGLLALLLLMSSFGPFVSLADLGSGLQNTFAAGNRVLDLLEESPVAEDITQMAPCTFDGAQMNQVSFSYGGQEILHQVSIPFPKGQVVGIVGKSGSGKSTLLKLLMRFWVAQAGEITLSNRGIDQINTQDLREMEGFVTQETHLFHDSIANNLRIAKQDATQQELEEACKKASVHDFILQLPQGYDTLVGELGDTLSGGERQRMGLARAFLHDAPFLLLDEPTSNLDSLNEAIILQSIARERGDKTVVLVSHRASTMRLADQVYTVEHGRSS